MAGRLLTVEQVLTILPETPARIAALTADLTPDRLRASPSFGGWSLNAVLSHLRACADVWGGCIATMLAENGPTLRAVNPRSWIHKTDYLEQDFAPSLQAFTKQRADLLRKLESLQPEDWSRSATVTGAGAVLQRTVLSYAQWLARHERSHYRQLQNIATAVRG